MHEKPLEIIRKFIESVVAIKQRDWDEFESRLAHKTFLKDEVISRAGEVENFIYFMYEGVSRIFQQKNDTEYTLRFNFPICVFNSYSSFITQTPSLINVEAVSKIKCFRMSYKDMQSLYDEAPMADRVGRRIIELLYVKREMKELLLHSKTAEDYYIDLINSNEKLTQLIPQKYLASYLSITPESLSRIKRKIKQET